MARLDEALGGNWWRDLVRHGVTDQAVGGIVRGFVDFLARATGMHIFAIPVRRSPSQKPVYFLVFGTRNPLGIWHFADDAARATETWWSTLDAQEAARLRAIGQDSLFDDEPVAKRLDQVESRARPVIAENIARLTAQHGQIRVGNYPAEVFGEYLGRVREKVVRAAIKDLHRDGRTPSDGKGKRIADLVVSPQR